MSKDKSRTPGRVKSGIGRIFGKSMMELSLFSKVDAHTRHLDNKPSLPLHRRHVKDKSGDEVKRENEEVGTERNKGDTPSKGLEQGAGEMLDRVINGTESIKGGWKMKGLEDKPEDGHAVKRGLGESWSVDINSGSKSTVCRRNSLSSETAGTACTGEDNRKRFERKGSSDHLNASTESRSKKKSRKLTKKEREKRKKCVKRDNEDWSENESDEDAIRLLNRRNRRFGSRNNDRSKKQCATAKIENATKSVAYDLEWKNSTDISNLGSNKLAAQYNLTEDWSFEIKEENEKMDMFQGLGRNSCNENESPGVKAIEDVKVSEINQIDKVRTVKGSLIENVGAADIKSVNAVKIKYIQCVDAKTKQISEEKVVEQLGRISDQIGDSIKQNRDTMKEENTAIDQISNESSEQFPKEIIFPQMQSTPKKETTKRCSIPVESTGNNETINETGAEIGKAEHKNQGISPFHCYSSEELRKIGRNMPPVDIVKNGLIDCAEMPEDIVNVDEESDEICSDEWKPGYGLYEDQKLNEPYYMSERCQSPYKDFERLYAINDEKNEGGRLERIAEEVVQLPHFQFSAPMEFSNPPPNFHSKVPEQFRPPLTMSDSEFMPGGQGLFPILRGSRRGYGRGNALRPRGRPFTHNRYDYGNSWISGSSGYFSGYSDKPFRRDYAHMVENRKELLLMDLGASWTHQESEDWTSEIADCGHKKETFDNENVKEGVKLSKIKQESKMEIQETENWESEIDEKEKIDMNLDACVKEGDVLQECVKEIKCELIDENVKENASSKKELYLPPPIPENLDISENIGMEKDAVVEMVQKSDKPYLPPPIPDMGDFERNENENVTGLVDEKVETSNKVYLPPSIPTTENKRMVENHGSLYLPPSPPILEVSLDADKLVNVLSKEKENYVEQLGNNVESLDNVKDGYERDDDTEKDSLEASSYGLSKASATKICAWFEKMPDETSSISSGWTQPEAVYTNVASETEVSDLPLDNVVKCRKEKLDRNVMSSSSGSMISVKSDVINATQEESTDEFKVGDESRGTPAQMNDPYGSRGSGYSPGYEHPWYYNPWMNGNCGYPSEQEYWYHTQQQMAWEWYVYQQELERMHQVNQANSQQTLYKSEMSERNADMGGMGKRAESMIVGTSKKLHEEIEPVCADRSDNDKPKKWATWKDSQELSDYEKVYSSNKDERAEVFGTEYARERGVGRSLSKNNERPLPTVPETSEVKGTENIPRAKNQNTTKSDSMCRCRPCDIKYIIWQECKCPAGNPRKLRILPHIPGEGSVDLGYQSYESLEHEEPTLHSRLSAWQPFSSTPALKEPILELTEQSVGCERKISIGRGQYQDVDQRCSANREVFACSEKANKESSATEKNQTQVSHRTSHLRRQAGSVYNSHQPLQDYQGHKFPHRDYRNLPKCLETSASHLAAAMEGLNQAGISEKSLDSALHSVTKRLEEFKKQAGMGDYREDLGSDNVGKRSQERDTDFNGNEIGGDWAEAQEVEKRNSSELSERHIVAYSEKIQGFSQFVKEKNIQNVSEMNPSGYQMKGRNFASLDSGLKPQLFSPERPKTPPSSPVKGQITQKAKQQYLNARQLQQQVGWKPQTLTSLLETIQKTTGVKFDENGEEVIEDNGDKESIPEHDMLGTNFRPPGYLWGPNDYRFPRAMSYRPDCRGLRPPPLPYTPPPPPPPPPPTPASAEDKDYSKKGEERFNWDPRMPQNYQMSTRMPPFVPRLPPGPQMPYGPQLPYAYGPGQFFPRFSPRVIRPLICNDGNIETPSQQVASAKKGPVEDIKGKFAVVPKAEGKVPWKLVEYAASDESSGSDIEPFDLATLNKVDSMTFYAGKHTVSNKTPADHTAKKFKTSPAYEEVKKGATKVARDVSGKVKQKTLKSFTAEDPLKKGMVVYSQKRHSPWNNHPSSVVASHSAKEESQNMYNKGATRNKAFATVVAENNRTESSQSASRNDEYEAEKCVDEKENASSYMLPPKNNSPFFWGNYTPPSNSALTGKSVEPEPTAKMGWEPQGSTPKMKRRLSNLGVSPGQSGSPALYSPAETETEIQSVRTQWRTNFKLFHDFGVMYIDTHCHLDFLFSREKFEGRTLSAYREKHPETFPDQFEGCVAVFCNPQTFTPGGGLWQDVAKEDNVWIAMGCHPKMATGFNQNAEKGLKRCMKHPKCIALGEIGLDYSGSFYQHMEVQKRVFRTQLEMAITMRKPLVIHCRDAEEDCLEIMKEVVPRNYKIHCHCFTQFYANAKLWLEAFPNLFIGVTPLVTYRSAKPTHDLAKNIPINRLLLETDAPYFIPRCIPKDELEFSNPGLAVTVAKEIAQYQEIPVAMVLRQCRINTKFVYGV